MKKTNFVKKFYSEKQLKDAIKYAEVGLTINTFDSNVEYYNRWDKRRFWRELKRSKSN